MAQFEKIEDFIQAVRLFMRDWPHLNRLIGGEEANDRMIAFAIVDAIDMFNYTPPLIQAYNLSNFPSVSLLIRLTVASLLESIILLGTRNYLSYNDGGGVSFTTHGNLPLYQNMLGMLQASNAQKVRTLKIATNIDNALDNPGIRSEYDWVHGYLMRLRDLQLSPSAIGAR